MKRVLINLGYLKKVLTPESYKNGELGGTEYCVIFLAKELEKNGYEVVIQGNVEFFQQGNITYAPYKFLSNIHFDVVIGVAYIHFLKVCEEQNFTFDKAFFWLHNEEHYPWYQGETLPNGGLDYLDDKRIDKIVCVSQAHREKFILDYKNKLTRNLSSDTISIENAIDTSFSFSYPKVKNRIIWSSGIDRGLKSILLKWGEIKNNIPDASILVCAPEYSLDYDFDTSLFQQQGVIWKGNLNPRQLRQEQSKAEWWIYPSNYFETYCISQLEMMFSKVKTISSGVGNLKYLADNNRGTLLEDLSELEFIDNFISILKRSASDKSFEYFLIKKVRESYEWAKQQTWENRVKEWIAIF